MWALSSGIPERVGQYPLLGHWRYELSAIGHHCGHPKREQCVCPEVIGVLEYLGLFCLRLLCLCNVCLQLVCRLTEFIKT